MLTENAEWELNGHAVARKWHHARAACDVQVIEWGGVQRRTGGGISHLSPESGSDLGHGVLGKRSIVNRIAHTRVCHAPNCLPCVRST